MWRQMALASALVFTLVLQQAAVGQDSGPGPVDGTAGSGAYDGTVTRFIKVSSGGLPCAAEGTEGTSRTATGDLTVVIGADTKTGTWHAVDLGDFSLWVATAQSGTSKLTAVGYSTPDFIAGRLTTTSTTSSG